MQVIAKPGERGAFAPLIFRRAAHWKEHSRFAESDFRQCGDIFYSLPPISMGLFQTGSQTPESKPAPASSGGTSIPMFRLSDDDLVVAVYAKELQKGQDYVFAVPERIYKNKDGKWVSSSMFHVEELLRMASLLTQAHIRLQQRLEIAKQE